MLDFKNLPRWIYASASKTIIERAEGAITFVEGLDKLENPTTAAEFRMDGPRFRELSKGYWEVWIAINCFCSWTMDDKDFHKKYVTAGILTNALKDSFSVFKFGDGIDDNRTSKVGCFTPIQDAFNKIQFNYFGQIGPTLRVEQGTIEAHYHMYLEE